MDTDWRERYDEEDDNWYQPTKGQAVASMTWSEDDGMRRLSAPMHPISSRLDGVHDLVMIEDEEGADDDDNGGDGIIDCRGSAAGQGWRGRGRTEVLFREQLVLVEDGAIVEHGILLEGLDLAGCRTGRPVACTTIVADRVVGSGSGAGVAWIGAHDEWGSRGNY